jgi:FkbM family methyltransferase
MLIPPDVAHYLRKDVQDEFVFDGDIDVAVDIGAHCGTFTCMCLDKGAKHVYSFEPNPDMFSLLKANVEVYEKNRWRIFDKAVIAGNDSTVDFYTLKHKGNSGQSSVLYKETFPKIVVPAINLPKLTEMILAEHDEITVFKMDIEAGEWPIFKLGREIAQCFEKVRYAQISTHPLPPYHENFYFHVGESSCDWIVDVMFQAGLQQIESYRETLRFLRP